MKTEKEKNGIIQNNKSIGNLSKMIKELKLEVDEMYRLLKLNNDFEKNDILKKDSNLLTYGDLIVHMNKIYQKRNKYVHGAFEINENSAAIDIPLKDLKIKKGTLVASILRNGKMIFPGGSDVIKCNDSVMVVTTASSIEDFDDILE